MALAVAVVCWPAARAQSVPPIGTRVTYILPQWGGFLSATPAEVKTQADILRARLGPEGPRVKLGFTTYVRITMHPVDPADTAAVDDALAETVAQIDAAIARARYAGIPLCLSFVTAIRGAMDPAQQAAQDADRRSMQWHADNSMASGWMSLSRYSRQYSAMEEAFVRALGRVLAARMLAYPDTLVAASGDGEVELSSDKSIVVNPLYTEETSLLADYSPFAIAEFRDWLRNAGLYAPGQPFEGEAWTNSSLFAGDVTPVRLNAYYGTTFATWDLKYFNWSLDEPVGNDGAIPSSVYGLQGWQAQPAAFPDLIAGGFDAPRVRNPAHPWWALWDQFRQTMVWRHNLAFARWITTSPDPASGATVPADRWFSDQIPADYLFGQTPDDPPFRLATSASPFWTADVSPYGSLGITSFNVNFGNGYYGRTLAGVAPRIAQRGVRWGIFEWSPSVGPAAESTPYDDDMALVERYRPSVLAPWAWDRTSSPVLGTPFESALRNLVRRLRVVPLTLSRTVLYASATTDGTVRTPAQVVRVTGAPGERPPVLAGSASSFLEVVPAADGRSFGVALREQSYVAGSQLGMVVFESSDPGYSATVLTVNLTVRSPAATSAPFGSFDTPVEGVTVSGEVAVTGWAVDDVGVAGVDIYRSPLRGEGAGSNGLVYLGTASQVSGARPDVEEKFGTNPLADRAGWGYMLLTNMLPNGGNGTFRLWAYARDYEGHTSPLPDAYGRLSRTVNCDNSSALPPFGTIDTPAQGETVSGTIVNFGWALTPQPAMIPADGSTIDVIVDGKRVGHPVYNQLRADIAALFPGYQNSSGPVGYYYLDTTTLSDGVHTIEWLVRDSAGRAQGMGSRYFTVANY